MESKEKKLLEEQKNKKHRGIREKIKKRRDKIKQKREHKKQKKEKHIEKMNEMNTDENLMLKAKRDKEKQKDRKIGKYVKKFMRHFDDDVKEFYEIFGQLDQGQKIDISGIENQKVKKYLEKIFRKLNKTIEYDEKTKEFGKIEKSKEYLQIKIKAITEQVLNGDQQHSDDTDKEEKDKIRRKRKNQQHEEEQIQIDQKRFEFIKLENIEKKKEMQQQQIDDKQDQVVKKIKGPQISEEQKMKFLQNSLNSTNGYSEVGRQERDKDLDQDFLKGIFDKSQQSRLGMKYKQIQEEVTEEEKQKQKEIQEYMKKYDQQFRQKSLMEIHQEKKAMKKQGQGLTQNKERQEFNRNELNFQKIDSKQVFSLLNSQNQGLDNRFKNRKYETSFM